MKAVNEIWAHVLELLREELTATAIETWFSECRPLELTESRFVLHTPSPFKREIIEGRFSGALKNALRELFAGELDVIVIDDGGLEQYKASDGGADGDNEEFTFERFVVGNSNRFAHAAALAVADGHIKDYNPLFIYGDSGLGKTHLLHAIRHAIQKKHPDYQIVYVKGDDFTNEFISAVQAGENVKFRTKYRNGNVFLMDDIQFIAGKERTEEEFFHTFNTLYESGRQIVLTCDRPPNELSRLEDRLSTRFEWGLIVDIQPPDYETRMAIIRNKAQQLGYLIPDDIAIYIAENMSANIRQLEGAVKRIVAHRDLMDQDNVTIASVSKQIKDMIKETERALTADIIIEETAKYFNLTTEELKGQRRTRGTATARQVSMFLIRKLTPLSLTDIGNIYEGRDHTTVLSAVRKIEAQIKTSDSFSQSVRDVTSNINAKAGL
jgi:chromosomal replication initiator protein